MSHLNSRTVQTPGMYLLNFSCVFLIILLQISLLLFALVLIFAQITSQLHLLLNLTHATILNCFKTQPIYPVSTTPVIKSFVLRVNYESFRCRTKLSSKLEIRIISPPGEKQQRSKVRFHHPHNSRIHYLF